MLKHVNTAKGLEALEDKGLNYKIDRLNLKWETIGEYAKILDICKEIPEKDVTREAYILWLKNTTVFI